MDGAGRIIGVFMLMGAPHVVNWLEFDSQYPLTAVFIGVALSGLFAEILSVRQLVLTVHRMTWKQTYHDDPPD